MRSSLEATSSSLRAFSAARVALGRQQDRQPLGDFLADKLLLHLIELPLDLGQRCDVARANAALPQGLALLAERFHRLPALLLALRGRALIQALAKLEPKLLDLLQHLVLDVENRV